MLRTVRGHAALAELLGAEYLVHLEDLVKAERLSYRTATWLRALGYLQDDILANPGLAQLSRPERHAIKNAFHGFNEVFHEIYFSQKGYTVPDASLREQVRFAHRSWPCWCCILFLFFIIDAKRERISCVLVMILFFFVRCLTSAPRGQQAAGASKVPAVLRVVRVAAVYDQQGQVRQVRAADARGHARQVL
jgi:hypothetical protein